MCEEGDDGGRVEMVGVPVPREAFREKLAANGGVGCADL